MTGKKRLSKRLKRISQIKTSIHRYINSHPFTFFYLILGLFVLSIIAGNIIRTPKKESSTKISQPKTIHVYSPSKSPTITTTGKIDKSGVIQITSLTGGVVQKIYVKEGKAVKKGSTLVSLASNYLGGNTFSIQRKIAQTQNSNTNETYEAQRQLIQKQKDIANYSDQNNDELREITEKSISETQSLISLNDSIIKTFDDNLKLLELDSVANADLILATKQQKSQFLAANNQARNALRQTEYQTNQDNPPSKLSDLQKEIAQSQLDLQLKSIDLNKEISSLQLKLAQTVEATMRPSAPFQGVVQKIYVKEGQAINPGTPVLLFSQTLEDDPITLTVLVTSDVAQKISLTNPSTILLKNNSISLKPYYVSSDPVDGALYAVYYSIPDTYFNEVEHGSNVSISIPLNVADRSGLYVPIDSIHQTTEGSYVYILQSGKAQAKKVRVGKVYGDFAEISGATSLDKIILERNVMSDEEVVLQKETR